MKCGSFPNCSLDCAHCKEYIEDNNPKDELKDYFEDIEADNYLSSLEFHESRFIQ